MTPCAAHTERRHIGEHTVNLHQRTMHDIGQYRAAVREASTLEALHGLAEELIGHAEESMSVDEYRAHLLAYLDVWEAETLALAD
jgi:hypothetical protein